MAINITDGFNLNYPAPVDYRMVVSNSTARLALTYKYDGLKVFQLDNRVGYIWNSGGSGNWDIENSDKISGSGTTNYIPKFTGIDPVTGSSQIGNSPIFASGSNVGIGTNNPRGSYTYLQIGGTSLTEDPNWYGDQSQPLTIHRGDYNIIGHNWYWTGTTDAYFNSGIGSSQMVFLENSISFKTRPGSGSFVYNMTIYPGYVIFSDNIPSGSTKSPMIRSQGSTSYSTQTTPDFTWWNNDQTGIFIPSANTIAFTNNGTESVRIESNGYVGIGNSTATYKLTVSGLVQGYGGTAYGPNTSKTVGGQVLNVGSSVWYSDVHLLTGQVSGTNNGFIQVTLGDTSYTGSNIGLTPYNLNIQPGGGNTFIGVSPDNLVSITPNSSNLLTVTGTASINDVKLSIGTSLSPSLKFSLSTNTGLFYENFYTGAPYTFCPDPNTLILLSDGYSIRAGDLKIGDLVYTIHETTGVWGNYKVSDVETIGNQDKILINFSDGTDISVSKSHKFLMIDNNWKIASDLLIDDSIRGIESNKTISLLTAIGLGDVVKIEVEDAHTYVSAGVISHNKFMTGTSYPSVLGFSVGGTQRMRIDGNGNLGVGLASGVMPKSKLHVVGLVEYASNATSIAAGLTAGAFYRTGEFVKVVY